MVEEIVIEKNTKKKVLVYVVNTVRSPMKNDQYDSFRTEGRVSINNGFGLSLLGFKVNMVHEEWRTKPKKVFENVYLSKFPIYKHYDYVLMWYPRQLNGITFDKIIFMDWNYGYLKQNYKFITDMGREKDFTYTCLCDNLSKYANEHPSEFPTKIEYLPGLYPIPSINTGFIPYKFEPINSELNIDMYCGSGVKYKEKQQFVIDFFKSKDYKINLYIHTHSEEMAKNYVLKADTIHYIYNTHARYIDVINNIKLADICITTANSNSIPRTNDIISLGKPIIIIGDVDAKDMFTTRAYECFEYFLNIQESDEESTKKLKDFILNPKESYDKLKYVYKDNDFNNWKEISKKFFINEIENNEVKNNGDKTMNIVSRIPKKINKFGDGISWENHVHEIIDTHKESEIFYGSGNHEKINHIKKYKSNGKVLDCGCHVGRWIEVFRGNGYDYTGVDQSLEALETAKKYKPDGNFVHNLLWNIEFDEEFDIVHTNAVLQHNKLSEQEKILPEMYKALKPNGILVIAESTVINQTSTQRTYKGWIKFIEKHGFKFMESWHKNELELEDNYIFIKTENIASTLYQPKNVTKESLVQLLKTKTSNQEVSNQRNITSVYVPEKQLDFKEKWNIFLTLQGNNESTSATSKDITTPLENMKERLNHYNVDNYFGVSKKILVVGAGDGSEVKVLNEKGYNTTGTTLHWSDKKFAKDFYGIDLEVEDMHKMSFPKETFDGVYSHHTLEHAISPLIVLYEIKRVLTKNGKLYIIVPQSGTSNETGIQHYSVLTETSWKHLLDIVGFKNIEVYSESGNTIMKATKDAHRICPGKQFEIEIENLKSKPQILNCPNPNITSNEISSNRNSDISNLQNWWNSYLAISNKIDCDGHGIEYSNLNDTSSSGLVYYVNEFCDNVPLFQYTKILDIGAGNGGETKVLIDKGYTVTGITLGKDNIKFAKEKYNVDLIEMDMNHLDFLINSFDAVMMIQTFEHFLSPFIATIEIWRALRKDGLCYLDVPCPLDKPMWSVNHTNLLYVDQIINMFSMCGFELVKELSKKKEHRIRLLFKKLSISKIRNWEQLRIIHNLRNKA